MTSEVDIENVDSIIYVHGPITQLDLVNSIAAAVEGEVDGDWVEAEGKTFVVDLNSDADAARASHRPEGFLYFDYRVEVYFVPALDIAQRISTVARLLETFWDTKWPAVAANTYEHQLPHKGGAEDDGSLPWPDRNLQ